MLVCKGHGIDICMCSRESGDEAIHVLMQCSIVIQYICCALQLLLCPLSQAGQSAIIDAVWTEVLLQLLVASGDILDEVLYTPWSCIL